MDEIYFYDTKPVAHEADDHYTIRTYSKKKYSSKAKIIVRTFAIAVAMFLLGVGVGFWSCKLKKTLVPSKSLRTENEANDHQHIAEEIDSKEIEANLRLFTKRPHNAGTKRNRELAEYIKTKWEIEYGIESKLIRYNVLLSFPSLKKRSAVYLTTSEGKVKFVTQSTEKPVEASEEQDSVLPPFGAYSPSGSVTGDIIYVNYGTAEDFEYLAKHNITCKGKIAIVRYGGNFRGDKVILAHDHGAVGVIVYGDPADYAPVPAAETYPKSKYLPCSGVQRGSFLAANGDPETPGYPSRDGIFRVAKDEINLPRIPVYPISACDAYEILRRLKKIVPTPDTWQGGMNISYNIGPEFQKPYDTWNARLEVYNEERREDIYDVVGTIRGKHEPDRRVIIGNHRDAWVFGGVDPSGGTACLMEIARALGRAVKKGWRPRRTIMLSSWGGEEYGMIGSTEYTEEFTKTLKEEAVAYLNLDSPVRGDYSLFMKSSPLLIDVFFKAARKVKNPANKKETVFDQWLRNLPSEEKQWNLPRVGNIAIGSDYVAFNQQLGIPSAEIRYVASKDNFGYPVYHSVHDTFHYVKTFIDPEFRIHRAIARVMMHSMLMLADYEILPMNASKYSEILTPATKKLARKFRKNLEKHNISIGSLEKAVEMFASAAAHLQRKAKTTDKHEALQLRQLNDKIASLEKGFISDADLPGQHHTRHIIFGINPQNSYKTVRFPGLFNALTAEPEDKRSIKEQINILITNIQSLANYLNSFE